MLIILEEVQNVINEYEGLLMELLISRLSLEENTSSVVDLPVPEALEQLVLLTCPLSLFFRFCKFQDLIVSEIEQIPLLISLSQDLVFQELECAC